MLIKNPPGWELPESLATPEDTFWNRRKFLAAGSATLGVSTLGASALGVSTLGVSTPAHAAPPATAAELGLYPATRNPAYKVSRPITPLNVTSKYNNFYEFGSHKKISKAAQALKLSPWNITIDGEAENPQILGFEDLLKKMAPNLEERVYRHRCVEAWAMTVPWTGFALKHLIALARPTARARYLQMQSFLDPATASGQKQVWYPWPYTEALTLAEAQNDLAFLATGIYAKPLLKQFGAPLRLAVPWKYGFKSVKSITRFTFTAERPVSFWQAIQPSEYGFWANVNPAVPHARWSQARERLLGGSRRVPTRIFNGYGEFVADLYAGMEKSKIWY